MFSQIHLHLCILVIIVANSAVGSSNPSSCTLGEPAQLTDQQLFEAAIVAGFDVSQSDDSTTTITADLDDEHNRRALLGDPICPDFTPAICSDGDGSCTDGDDDWNCDGAFYCSNDGADYAADKGGVLCSETPVPSPNGCEEACLYQMEPQGEEWTPSDGNVLSLGEDPVYFGYLSCTDKSETNGTGTNVELNLEFLNDEGSIFLCRKNFFEFDACFGQELEKDDECYEVGSGRTILLGDDAGVWVFSMKGHELAVGDYIDVTSLSFECTDSCGFDHPWWCWIVENKILVGCIVAASCILLCCLCCVFCRYCCSCSCFDCSICDILCCDCDCCCLRCLCCILDIFGLGWGDAKDVGGDAVEMFA